MKNKFIKSENKKNIFDPEIENILLEGFKTKLNIEINSYLEFISCLYPIKRKLEETPITPETVGFMCSLTNNRKIAEVIEAILNLI